jgi:hypothetical protein
VTESCACLCAFFIAHTKNATNIAVMMFWQLELSLGSLAIAATKSGEVFTKK